MGLAVHRARKLALVLMLLASAVFSSGSGSTVRAEPRQQTPTPENPKNHPQGSRQFVPPQKPSNPDAFGKPGAGANTPDAASKGNAVEMLRIEDAGTVRGNAAARSFAPTDLPLGENDEQSGGATAGDLASRVVGKAGPGWWNRWRYGLIGCLLVLPIVASGCWLLWRKRPVLTGVYAMTDQRNRPIVIHPRSKASQPNAVEEMQRRIDDLTDLVRHQHENLMEQNRYLIELVTRLVGGGRAAHRDPPPSRPDDARIGGGEHDRGAAIAADVATTRSSRDFPTIEDQYAVVIRDPRHAEEFINRNRVTGWSKRNPQSASEALLVQSVERDWQQWDFLVTAGGVQTAERVVLPGIWHLNNPTALLADGGRAGRKFLAGVFDLREGAEVKLVRAAAGDSATDGIRIRRAGVLELPGLGSL